MVKLALASAFVAGVEAGTLAVTWEDCGAKHAKVTDLQPTSFETGTTVQLVGSGTTDEDVTSAKFTATISAAGAKLTQCSGDATSDITCKLPLGAGRIVVKAVSYPLTKGPVDIITEVSTSSLIPASLAKVDVHIAATEQNGEDVICLDVHTAKQDEAAAVDPDQPHLSQAWIAKSTGDGMPDAIGDEAYLWTDNEMHHLFDYGADVCQKLVTCPNGPYSCTAYYVKCDAVNCCKCDNADEPKKWDINNAGLFTKVNFVGYEDTTELNNNPITGAEHWSEHNILPKVLTVDYDYYLHREDNGDVVSHRIDFNTGIGANVSGSILYGGFQVQHDIDAHRQRFALPDVCKGNILDCGCDDGGDDEKDAKFFKHDFARRMAKKTAKVMV
jgi:hypothetical protein